MRRRSGWLGGRRLGAVVGLGVRCVRVRMMMWVRDGCWVCGGMHEAENWSERHAAS